MGHFKLWHSHNIFAPTIACHPPHPPNVIWPAVHLLSNSTLQGWRKMKHFYQVLEAGWRGSSVEMTWQRFCTTAEKMYNCNLISPLQKKVQLPFHFTTPKVHVGIIKKIHNCYFILGQRKLAIVHFFAVVQFVLQLCHVFLQLCFLFSRCAKTMYYSYIQFCWCTNEIAVVLCILQLYIQFVSCELFSQLYNIFPCFLSQLQNNCTTVKQMHNSKKMYNCKTNLLQMRRHLRDIWRGKS